MAPVTRQARMNWIQEDAPKPADLQPRLNLSKTLGEYLSDRINVNLVLAQCASVKVSSCELILNVSYATSTRLNSILENLQYGERVAVRRTSATSSP